MQLILASQSPRRKELLGLFRIPFRVQVADIDETTDPTKTPAEEVARLSREKALAIPRTDTDVVVAADTIVVLEDQILGKPHSKEEAIAMLTALSGREHRVMTGVTVVCGDTVLTHTEITHIHFRALSQKEILAYVATGEPMDKAGSYGIQGGAALFVRQLQGDYFNVVGLPVCALHGMLRQAAPTLLEEME